jgi:integration host factor subunit alpha
MNTVMNPSNIETEASAASAPGAADATGESAFVNSLPSPIRLVGTDLETPTLTKAELSELLFERIGLNKRESKDMVDQFFTLVHEALLNGQDVKLSGFGNFHLRDKSQRPGRNPRTGEAIPIQARRVVTFHTSHKLKDMVQSGRSDELDFE